MYKVFINDKPIILSESLIETSNYLHYSFENIVLDEVIHKLKFESLKGVVLVCKHLENDWNQFQSHFTKVVAAGGLVMNEKNEFLFIYRGQRWDLPKGRIEPGENLEQTAIREVQEECGIQELRLHDFLMTTYHIFFLHNQQKLKETHWYLMHSHSSESLKPQYEEGITEVVFKDKPRATEALENTYANIKLVFESFSSKV